ncbi:hypothetical protein J8F10_12050 [Gemmata sp. G18]|uniref:DUF1918 domain-containing protein n=1 Tax=Gemmata palustris TaxID=2822762 RepID=A0ABS5BQR9_9BACT|nr:hypothetical protein [Gemmata palustris]MBP3956018.1 hypothetical protein [Gemmata palustris]
MFETQTEPTLPYFRTGDRVRHRGTELEGVIVRECGPHHEIPIRQYWDVKWDRPPAGFARPISAEDLELIDGP